MPVRVYQCRSEPQMPQAWIFRSDSPGPGRGAGAAGHQRDLATQAELFKAQVSGCHGVHVSFSKLHLFVLPSFCSVQAG